MVEPKRVLHFQGRMGRGGAESFMMNAFREIDRNKYVFDFVIYEDYVDVRPYHEEIKELGGRIYVLPNPNRNILRYIKEVKRLLKNNKVDIVHNEIFFGGGINLLLAKQAGVKQRIAHSHATTDGKGNRLPYNILRPIFNKMMMNNATDFLACSKEAGEGLFGNDTSFVTIPNGIDLEKYSVRKISKTELKERIDIPTDGLVIGHIGRFEEQKNHVLLLDIFEHVLKKHPNTYLLSVGTGSLEDEIHALAKEKNIMRNIKFLGEREDINYLLQAMDVFLLPSLYEGLPMVAVEAQAAKVKLVMSTTVSKDTVLSNNVKFVSLDDSLDSWESSIFSEPLGNTPLPALSNYDMRNTATLLSSIYI